ncbi:MAG: DegT/DnrJ/EryC1/StrS family aminotransferase [Vicinamibacterales bacterium]
MTRPAIPFGRPSISEAERAAVMAVLGQDILTHGPRVREFEQVFAAFAGDGAHCLAVSSCMAALHLAYLHLGLGPGDEVIVPAQTHTATAHAVEAVGARPVFVDCEEATGNIDPALIADAITPRTRAVSLVHFIGIPCRMHEILGIASRHGLSVVEDCALAVGARYDGRHVGLFGDIGCFSFYPVKHLTTAEGGMVTTRHQQVASAVAALRAFGVDRSHGERAIPGMYDVVAFGLNYRMSELQAALGVEQVKRVDALLSARRSNFLHLQSALAEIDELTVLDSRDELAVSSHYCMSIVLRGALAPRRDGIVARLNALGVGTSIYYPRPVPGMTYYRTKYGYHPENFPNAENISRHSIALPIAPHVTSDDVDYIADCLKGAIAASSMA